MYKNIRPQRLHEQLVERIEQQILTGVLKPGDRLCSERDLARQFGVSRATVRCAVEALRAKGLVETRSGRGTRVSNRTSQVMRYSLDFMSKIGQAQGLKRLAELRELLEPEIAALAAARAQKHQLAQITEALASLECAQEYPEHYADAELRFHVSLAEAAGNPLLTCLVDSIVTLLREERMRLFSSAQVPRRGNAHCLRIVKAIEQRRPEVAREAMRSLHRFSHASPADAKHESRSVPPMLDPTYSGAGIQQS